MDVEVARIAAIFRQVVVLLLQLVVVRHAIFVGGVLSVLVRSVMLGGLMPVPRCRLLRLNL